MSTISEQIGLPVRLNGGWGRGKRFERKKATQYHPEIIVTSSPKPHDYTMRKQRFVSTGEIDCTGAMVYECDEMFDVPPEDMPSEQKARVRKFIALERIEIKDRIKELEELEKKL